MVALTDKSRTVKEWNAPSRQKCTPPRQYTIADVQRVAGVSRRTVLYARQLQHAGLADAVLEGRLSSRSALKQIGCIK